MDIQAIKGIIVANMYKGENDVLYEENAFLKDLSIVP